jgi:hypothetical protein
MVTVGAFSKCYDLRSSDSLAMFTAIDPTHILLGGVFHILHRKLPACLILE